MDNTFNELFIRLQTLGERERFLIVNGMKEQVLDELDNCLDEKVILKTSSKKMLSSKKAKMDEK